MLKVYFRTNLDLLPPDLNWPEELPEIPRVGDLIRSPQTWKYDPGNTIGGQGVLELEVCRITWKQFDNGVRNWWAPEIELHLPKSRWQSLTHFYEWYGKITGKGKSFFI